jgi:RNA polymerase-binding transcription factor
MTSHIEDGELQNLRQALESKRDALKRAQAASRGEQRQGTDEVEEGDIAEQMIEQEGALRLAAFDATLLRAVEHALSKVDAGTYGISEYSGAPIPIERLRAIPWARGTAEEEEARARQ